MKKKKFLTGFILTLVLAAHAHAAKWETLVFNEDVNLGFIELDRYCLLHDISVADVLWANSIASSADVKAGTSIYLPANQADMLAIWQNQGAWKPTALVPVTSAAAAKKIAVEHEKKVEDKTKSVNHVTPMEQILVDPKESAELQAKLKELTKITEAPAPKQAAPEPVKEAVAEVKKEVKEEKKEIKTANVQDKYSEIIREIKVEKKETPQDAIAKMTKPDKILTEQPKKKSSSSSANDPIIVLSPNGDSSQGPMRLLIVGDKVEVVRIPENAVPKTPSVADLDHVFGTTPSYLPYYNMTEKPRNDYILNFRNLNGKMMWPVDGKVSSYFGWRGKRKHEGIDIPMPAGTPIRAARNGVVARTGNNSTIGFRGYGNFILLDHGGGLQSFYAHCSSVAVQQGQRIMQGQIVGYVGSTGRSTANHLHFEVRVNNAKVDPIPYLGGKTQFASHK
ncbi:MAG: M23 family metallopeptidase [Synergistaceae bacterium]|nr:M23 family metallopeptidase [Synergistaceae bacterium]